MPIDVSGVPLFVPADRAKNVNAYSKQHV
jgi:hypothetical protein